MFFQVINIEQNLDHGWALHLWISFVYGLQQCKLYILQATACDKQQKDVPVKYILSFESLCFTILLTIKSI